MHDEERIRKETANEKILIIDYAAGFCLCSLCLFQHSSGSDENTDHEPGGINAVCTGDG